MLKSSERSKTALYVHPVAATSRARARDVPSSNGSNGSDGGGGSGMGTIASFVLLIWSATGASGAASECRLRGGRIDGRNTGAVAFARPRAGAVFDGINKVTSTNGKQAPWAFLGLTAPRHR